jgi:hypothetical protein
LKAALVLSALLALAGCEAVPDLTFADPDGATHDGGTDGSGDAGDESDGASDAPICGTMDNQQPPVSGAVMCCGNIWCTGPSCGMGCMACETDPTCTTANNKVCCAKGGGNASCQAISQPCH